MCRRFDRSALIVCAALLIMGTSSLAEDDVFFDLSAAFESVVPTSDLSDVVVVVADESDAPAEDAVLANDVVVPADESLPASDGGSLQQEATPPEEPATSGFLGLWRRPAPTYPLPSRSFSLFQSPASYGWDYFERCCPRPWQPRGVGIPRRTSSFRMDYRPYTLQHTESVHGPAFYQRFELYPCEECCHHRKHLKRHYSCP